MEKLNLDFTILGAEDFFNPTPIREYKGHTADILDISWCQKVEEPLSNTYF